MKKDSISNSILISMLIICVFAVFSSCFTLFYNTIHSEVIHLENLESGDVRYCIGHAGICNHDTGIDLANGSRDSVFWVFNGNGNNQNYIDIEGWALIPGQDVKLFDVDILLKEVDDLSDSFIKMSTEMVERPEVTEHFKEEECDYNHTGFLASISLSDISENQNYQVYIHYKSDGYNYLVETDTVISSNSLGENE